MLNWWRRKAKKSGFISDIKRKSLTNPPTEKSRFKLVRLGWGTGIRTPEMSESESDALPLGDAPIFSTDDIIADSFAFVKGFFKKI